MSTLLWVVLPVFIAIGSALMAVYIMQQRMEVQLARERQTLSEARATIEAQRSTLDELHQLREEAVRRKALDEFLADLRTEERHFIREQKLLFANRKSLVLQERIYFRHIPLCNWVEHEVPIEDGADVHSLIETMSAFAPDLLGAPKKSSANRLLR
ncbi:MAG: hypothetical protein HY236_06220 [Acidobacteria bacterium]|nr:hypothetical protein [Acidobacteriota bacterium]